MAIIADGSTSSVRLIGVRSMAHKFSVHPNTVMNLARAGVIPASIKIGRRRLWNEAEIDAFIKGGCRPLKD